VLADEDDRPPEVRIQQAGPGHEQLSAERLHCSILASSVGPRALPTIARVKPTVLVDAENVRRSQWPNLEPGELVERCRAWAAAEGVELRVIFDGTPPDITGGDVEATAGSGADDRIAELAGSVAGSVWVVTSDRELRRRVAPYATRTIGGGTFLGLLDALRFARADSQSGDSSRRQAAGNP
jgi:hypothetical protein